MTLIPSQVKIKNIFIVYRAKTLRRDMLSKQSDNSVPERDNIKRQLRKTAPKFGTGRTLLTLRPLNFVGVD